MKNQKSFYKNAFIDVFNTSIITIHHSTIEHMTIYGKLYYTMQLHWADIDEQLRQATTVFP